MSGWATTALIVMNVVLLGYFVVLNAVYAVLTWLGWLGVRDYVGRRVALSYETIERSPSTPPISLIVPAYDEELTILDSVRGMLRARYPKLEVIVVNDGSRDATLDVLRERFDLVPLQRVPRARLPSAAISGILISRVDPRLVVIDKANGGKADAINAGLSFARYPLFCAVDSDTMLDQDALLRLVRPFLAEPEVIAVGGVVRVANGSRIVDGEVREVATSPRLLPNLQIVEYLRAFLAGRVGWSRLGSLLVISGAFGLFRRELVIQAGGYDTSTVGEDIELVVRLHRVMRERGEPYRITFIPDPVCWTEVPESRRVLGRQRNRWHRGLMETMWRHRRMVGNPRYGVVGWFGMPYFLFLEGLGPLIEVAGYAAFLVAAAMGLVSPMWAVAFFTLAVMAGAVLSFGALMIEERAFRRYRAKRCTARLVLAAIAENLGYRQWNSFVRAGAFISLMRGSSHWGEMQRNGFGGGVASSPALAGAETAASGDGGTGGDPMRAERPGEGGHHGSADGRDPA